MILLLAAPEAGKFGASGGSDGFHNPHRTGWMAGFVIESVMPVWTDERKTASRGDLETLDLFSS